MPGPNLSLGVINDHLFRIKTIKERSSILSFKHTGKMGDIIYSIPAMRGIAGSSHTIRLLIDLDVNSTKRNPLVKGLHLPKDVYEKICPLIKYQNMQVEIYQGQEDVIDLDLFRSADYPLNRGHIARWYHYIYPFSYSYHDSWLKAPIDDVYRENLVVTRTERYNNPWIDYKFLDQYKNVLFLGLEEEYIRLGLKHARFKKLDNFLEAATIINSCKFFVGNQTFLYSLAEGLKVPRILECFLGEPNVVTSGNNVYEACYQEAFEHAVGRFCE